MLSRSERFWLRVAARQQGAAQCWDELKCLIFGHRPKMYSCRRCGTTNRGRWTKRRFGRWR